ncbi:MAG: DUF1254 domain-containing protein [Beijerinckiaceae bacterium]
MKRGFFNAIPFILGAVIIAGLVHLLSILLLPRVAASNAFARLSVNASLNTLENLQSPDGTKVMLPFADPAMLTAICHYDVTQEPVRLKITTGDDFMSIVFLDPEGKVIYSLTDKAATRRLIEIVIGSPAQIRQITIQDSEDEAVQELRLRLANPRGMAIIRALAPRSSDVPQVSALLDRSDCQQE